MLLDGKGRNWIDWKKERKKEKRKKERMKKPRNKLNIYRRKRKKSQIYQSFKKHFTSKCTVCTSP